MKVMQIQDEWGPEHIKLAKRPDPEPSPGEIIIDMKATAINPRDLILTQRGYGRHSGELPLIPLADGAGYVSAVGEGATKFQVGEMRWLHIRGEGYAPALVAAGPFVSEKTGHVVYSALVNGQLVETDCLTKARRK